MGMQLASGLVKSTLGITEETARMRVAQKFGVLRVRVLRNYVGPFARGVIEKELMGGGGGGERVERVDVHKNRFVFGT